MHGVGGGEGKTMNIRILFTFAHLYFPGYPGLRE